MVGMCPGVSIENLNLGLHIRILCFCFAAIHKDTKVVKLNRIALYSNCLLKTYVINGVLVYFSFDHVVALA